MNFSPQINHTKWQILLIPVGAFLASLIILYSSDTLDGKMHFPWRTFFMVAVFTYFIWQANLVTYKVLDKKMAFYEEAGKRILFQLLLCCIATWLTFSILYAAVDFYTNRNFVMFSTKGYFLFLVIATGISLAINSLYVIRYLQSTVLYKEAISTRKVNELLQQLAKISESGNIELRQKTDSSAQLENNLLKQQSLIIETGSKTLNVPFTEMAYWFSSGKLVTLVTREGKKITTNFKSFGSFVSKLPADQFFQLSRQFITHIQSIVTIEDDINGKLVVELSAARSFTKTEKVTVSRYRSQELKNWFAQKAVHN